MAIATILIGTRIHSEEPIYKTTHYSHNRHHQTSNSSSETKCKHSQQLSNKHSPHYPTTSPTHSVTESWMKGNLLGIRLLDDAMQESKNDELWTP